MDIYKFTIHLDFKNGYSYDMTKNQVEAENLNEAKKKAQEKAEQLYEYCPKVSTTITAFYKKTNLT